jgi:hypothetical protein
MSKSRGLNISTIVDLTCNMGASGLGCFEAILLLTIAEGIALFLAEIPSLVNADRECPAKSQY